MVTAGNVPLFKQGNKDMFSRGFLGDRPFYPASSFSNFAITSPAVPLPICASAKMTFCFWCKRLGVMRRHL